MALNPTDILGQLNNSVSGGREFSFTPPLNVNTGDLNQSTDNPTEQIFSQIPEETDSGQSDEIFKWDTATWFPEDLGTQSNAYYVKFEVYMLDTGKGSLSGAVAGDSGKEVSFVDGDSRMTQNLGNLEGQMRNNKRLNSLVGDATEKISPSSTRRSIPMLKKLSEVIALPMPESLVADHAMMWSRADGGMVSAMVAMGDEFLNGSSLSDSATKAAKSMTLGAASGATTVLEQMGAEGAKTNLKMLTKRAANPRSEFLFDGVNNRSFNLQWKLIPKSQTEAYKLRVLLEKMKLYMYPELDESTNGNFYLFPGIFDITFMHGAQENEWLYRTSTCALTNLMINYTGAGQWIATTYNGAPVAWDVTMQFTEMEFLHRARFKNNSNPNGVAR